MLKKPLKTENLAIPFYLKYRSIALVIEIPLLSHLYYLKCRRISWFHDLVQTVKRRILVISLENTTWYSISPCWFLVSLVDRRVLAKDPKSPRCPLLFISHGVSRVPRYSGSRLPVFIFRYRALTFCGRLSHAVLLISSGHDVCPQPRRTCVPRFGLLRVRSPLLAESRLMSFPGPT